MSTHFSFGFISLSYLGHILLTIVALVFCFYFSCFFASLLLSVFLSICPLVSSFHCFSVFLTMLSICIHIFLSPYFIFSSFFFCLHPIQPTRVSVLVVDVAQTEELVHL